MQHKCGEMSIQVTAALGTAIAALIIAMLSKSDPSTGAGQSTLLTFNSVVRFISALFCLYAVVQSLIIANYIYQTLQVLLLELGYAPLHDKIVQSSQPSIIKQIDRELSPSRQPGAWLRRGHWVATHSQPLIIYSSAFLGWVAFFLSILIWPSAISPWFLLLIIPASFSFGAFYLLHANMKKLAACDCWVALHEGDKAEKEAHQPQTASNS